MYDPGWQPGRWSFICDVCGFRYHSDKARKRWDGLIVCEKDWETRHPQTLLRVQKETISTPWARPEPAEDTFTHVCWVWERSSYAGLATAGCAIAGTPTQSYEMLLGLKNGN